MIEIDKEAPEFKEISFHEDNFKEIRLSDYKGKWVILFFYPADFTFVCPTELAELAKGYDELKSLNAEVISVSTDTEHVHKAWHENHDDIKNIRYPMLADPAARVCKSYGTYVESEGKSLRATFLIDPDGIIRAYEFHNHDIGRNFDEIKRKLVAAKFVRENNGQLCPMNWKPGMKTLTVD